MARPGIEPRTSDLRVRCPTDCATRPGYYDGMANYQNISKIVQVVRFPVVPFVGLHQTISAGVVFFHINNS